MLKEVRISQKICKNPTTEQRRIPAMKKYEFYAMALLKENTPQRLEEVWQGQKGEEKAENSGLIQDHPVIPVSRD